MSNKATELNKETTVTEPASSENAKLRLARRADRSNVVLALPQPGGADILRAKKALRPK